MQIEIIEKEINSIIEFPSGYTLFLKSFKTYETKSLSDSCCKGMSEIRSYHNIECSWRTPQPIIKISSSCECDDFMEEMTEVKVNYCPICGVRIKCKIEETVVLQCEGFKAIDNDRGSVSIIMAYAREDDQPYDVPKDIYYSN